MGLGIYRACLHQSTVPTINNSIYDAGTFLFIKISRLKTAGKKMEKENQNGIKTPFSKMSNNFFAYCQQAKFSILMEGELNVFYR